MPETAPRLSRAVTLACTAYVAVLVPAYWISYGFANFFSFCDIALFMAIAGLWRADRLLLSMALVATLVVDALWLFDMARGLAGLGHWPLTAYMFDERLALGLRGLSLFHLWLPVVLIWALWRLGYDRRALAGWAAIAVVTMGVSYAFLPPPDPLAQKKVNVNWVHGPSSREPQTLMPPWQWLVAEFAGLFALCWWPAHLIGGTVLRRPHDPRPAPPGGA